jgi:hypothetical protein
MSAKARLCMHTSHCTNLSSSGQSHLAGSRSNLSVCLCVKCVPGQNSGGQEGRGSKPAKGSVGNWCTTLYSASIAVGTVLTFLATGLYTSAWRKGALCWQIEKILIRMH